MATVTVTGGEGKDSLLLTYNNGARNSAEAQSIASIISGQFSSSPATYNISTPNFAGSNGYLVVTDGASVTDTRGFQAVTFDNVNSPATVLGGASGGQSVLGGGGGNIFFVNNFNNTLVDFAGGKNTFEDLGTTGNIIYGGSGADTYDIGGSDTIFAGSGISQINLTGSGFVNVTSETGALTVTGGSSSSPTSTIVGGTGALNLAIVGSGNYSVTGGTGGANTIIGGSGNETLTGASNGDYITAGTGNTSLVAGGGAELLKVGTGMDTVTATTVPGSSLIDFSAVSGVSSTYTINDFTVSSSNTIFAANSTDANYILNHQTITGGNIVTQLNASTTITLTNDTTLLTSSNVKPLS
jgi:Ca2+-binding RTX toxin-like protein